MQQRYLKYGLITGVIIVWGLIIIRIANNLDQGVSLPETVSNKPSFKSKDSSFYQPYDLLLNYADPFGADDGKYEKLPSAGIDEKATTSGIAAGNAAGAFTKPDISFVRYKGMIINSKTRKKAGIISINGKDQMVRSGEKPNGLHIGEIQKDKIRITYLGSEFSLKRQ